MAHVLLIYSEPVQSPRELLSGEIAPVQLGYRNVAISLATNVLARDIQQRIYTPAGFYIESDPTVTPQEPKGMLYTVVTTSVCFSHLAMGAKIARLSGSQSGAS